MSKYRSQDGDAFVENPAVDAPAVPDTPDTDEINATTVEPDMPPTLDTDSVNKVDSTRAPETTPPVPTQRFRFRSADEGVTDPTAPDADAAPADPEAPTAPTDPNAPSAPMAPTAPGADAAPADAPAAPAVVPADVPAAAPMTEPQPDAEVNPPEGAVAPVAPEVAATSGVGAVEPAPATPEKPPVDNGPQARFKQEDGEEIVVVNTPEPRTPPQTETTECPETGDECVDKNINKPINPVIEQGDGVTGDGFGEGGSNEDDPTTPDPEPTKDDETFVTPEDAQDGDDLGDPIGEIVQYMRMEGDAEAEAGDQDVNATVNVNVRKDDGDEHADDSADAGADVSDNADQAPADFKESMRGFKSQGGDGNTPSETVADVIGAPDPDDVVPVPDPNAGNPSPVDSATQMFGQWMQEGGDWL